ncbi:transmembrane adaptor Erv26 protein [Rutstroemia sp. NJR-2017a WRK4]|nr:transmembrane adaptor Erv26 protein [Rutstroemia sp. NJR-2017a WRK4]
MWILPLVGYLGMAVGFGFLTLAIASGLYYLSELVEEHTVMAKRFLTRMIYGIIGLQILLCLIDGFSFKLSALSVFSHVVYLGNMRRFPIVRLSDPLFITSCALVVINHYLWFVHFSSGPLPPTQSIYDAPQYPDFTQIASYFGLCVWMTPFALFVSLSASDNVLPTMGSEEPGMAGKDKASGRQGMAKVIVDAVRNGITELGRSVGWFKEDRGF